MFDKRVTFEWHQSEYEHPDGVWTRAVWPDAEPPPNPFAGRAMATSPRVDPSHRLDSAPVPTRFLSGLLRDVVILAMFALLAASTAFPAEQQQEERVRRELIATLLQEELVWAADDESRFDELIDTRADGDWRRDYRRSWRRLHAGNQQPPTAQLEAVEMHDSYAVVATRTTYPDSVWGAIPYRQYQFYRQVDGIWLRTFPPDPFWGESHVLETPHLRIVYRDWDAAVVRAAAPRLESAYTTLFELVDLDPPVAGEPIDGEYHDGKLTLQIVPRTTHSWSGNDTHIEIPSYVSIVSHPSLSDVDAFTQSVLSGMVFQTLREVRRPHDWSYAALWNATFAGLHSWLLNEVSGHPSLWDQRAETLLQEKLSGRSALKLTDLSYSPLPNETPEEWLWRMKAGEVLVDYVVTTHGQEQLPTFLAGLSRYNSWRQLADALYNVSMAEFEADWNAFVWDRYGQPNSPVLAAAAPRASSPK